MQRRTGSAFQNMRVWQAAMSVAHEVYRVSRTLPKDETYGLISQMRRCAISIPSNIAEGSKRGTRKDFVQFLRIASGSAAELETQLLFVEGEYNLDVHALFENLNVVQRMLETLMQKL